MTWILRIGIIFSALLLSMVPVRIMAAGSAGTSGADFLELGVGSRPQGMAEAFTAQINDVHSMYYNPAGIATLKYPMLSVQHQELILDSRLEYVAGAFHLPVGTLGFSHTLFWVPPFDKVDISGNTVGKVNFVNGALQATYGYSFGDVSLGGSVKWIYQKIDELFVNSVAFDFGVLVGMYLISPFDAPLRNFFIGFSVQNIGTYAKNDPLPAIIRLGFMYKLTKWFSLNVDVTETVIRAEDLLDFTHGFEENFRLNIGVEFTYLEILYLRGGYSFNNGPTYTVGLGVNFVIGNVSFAMDTSYAGTSVFGPVFTFNASFKLIPRVITVEDKRHAEEHYRRGIKLYVADDVESALEEFKRVKDYNPYYKSIREKIRDLEELLELKEENRKLDEKLKEQQTIEAP
jgi:hypothetical protein